MIRVPNRDVLSVIAHSDQRAVKFFEDLTASANASEVAIAGMGGGIVSSIVGITGTKAQFDTAVTDGNVQWVGDAPTAHTHLLAAGATDVTITAANLNVLDDGADTTLHFHAADRARAVHTGTQLAATISDFNTSVAGQITGKQDTLVSGTNIVTVNGNSLLGSGDLVVSGGGAYSPVIGWAF